jgi:hypothetical protein
MFKKRKALDQDELTYGERYMSFYESLSTHNANAEHLWHMSRREAEAPAQRCTQDKLLEKTPPDSTFVGGFWNYLSDFQGLRVFCKQVSDFLRLDLGRITPTIFFLSALDEQQERLADLPGTIYDKPMDLYCYQAASVCECIGPCQVEQL